MWWGLFLSHQGVWEGQIFCFVISKWYVLVNSEVIKRTISRSPKIALFSVGFGLIMWQILDFRAKQWKKDIINAVIVGGRLGLLYPKVSPNQNIAGDVSPASPVWLTPVSINQSIAYILIWLHCCKVLFGLVSVDFRNYFEFSATTKTRGLAYKLVKSQTNSGVHGSFFVQCHECIEQLDIRYKFWVIVVFQTGFAQCRSVKVYVVQ